MALTQIEEKYINLTLANLYENILIYKAKLDFDRYGARDRAIFRALYVQAIRVYNQALGTLGLVGTSNLARAQKPYSDRKLDGEGYGILSDEDIDKIVTQIFGVTKIERELTRYQLRKKHAEAFVIAEKGNKKLQEALKTILTSGTNVAKLINTEELLKAKPIEFENEPRGNPRKAGLISKYKAQGKTTEEAYRLAEMELTEEEYGDIKVSQSQAEADKKLAEAIALHGGTVEERNRERMAAEKKRADKILGILEDNDSNNPRSGRVSGVGESQSSQEPHVVFAPDISDSVDKDGFDEMLKKESQ